MIQEIDLTVFTATETLGGWLKQQPSLVVLLAKSDWRRSGKGSTLLEILRSIAADPQFQDKVQFLWFSTDVGGRECNELGIVDAPTLILFKKNEVARFCDIPARDMLIHRICELISPKKERHPATARPGSVPGASLYCL